MTLVIMKNQMIFTGQVKELLCHLQLWQQEYQTLKELLHGSLH
ncbi:hypothetical protein [Dehalobacterium formicoaceticum]|uniref:Uncharacterized protein n=1 Tax=Dehalobacterium formicoaceticum TaxID=51515 RepID=A0ABT1Y4K9_9FIRM|nr:hypothetical protein [Dehalobacterium formicoaceticum]MCR6545812.1 hypothetical protein [Dehalobacterium formicoaceticum]